MNSETRRSIIKILGSVPFAGELTAKKLALELASPAVVAGMATVGIGGEKSGETNRAEKALGPILGRRLTELTELYDRERGRRFELRGGGRLDADILALRSTSRVYKHMKQFERDCEADELWTRARKIVWG